MIRSEKLCEGNHSNRSDAAQSSSTDSGNSDCENRANERNEPKLFETGMVVLGLATSHNKEMKQVRGVDQTPYQSWHSPLRWATSYAHEVAPCSKVDIDMETAIEVDKAS